MRITINCVVLCIVCVNCVVLCTVCVQTCTVLLPPGINPTAVNKNIISYHMNAAARRCSAHAFRLDTQITQLHLPLNMTLFWGDTVQSGKNRCFQSTYSKFLLNAGTYQITRRHFTENSNVQNCRQENFKTHFWLV